ncbi:MAG: hypothetical protein E7381_05330 [Clostridiales bacterium]|nr:hypothetical protein [Clostridiales bacterium]
MSERICFARTVTERKVHLALREKLFPRRLQRQRLCASMAIAVVRRNKAFRQATVGCATNA